VSQGAALAADPSTSASPPAGRGGGVLGNTRLTATAGAVIFLLVAVEGATLLQIHQLIDVHVFVGLLLVPLVLLKLASTGWRFTRYYAGAPAYTRKGPPHPILRLIAPLVVVSTLALLGTGLALVALGRSAGHQYVQWHKLAFFAWLAIMAVHVLGHLQETVTQSAGDLLDRRRDTPRSARVGGARLRAAALIGVLAVGIVLGVLSLGWVGTWNHFTRFGFH